MPVLIDLWNPRPMGLQAEVYPARQFSKIDISAPVMGALHTGLVVPPGVVGAHGSADWLLATRSVFSYSLEVLGSAFGGSVAVSVSWDGTNFDLFQVFPIRPGTQPTVVRGVELVGWTAQFVIRQDDPAAARTVNGLIQTEAF